MHELSIATSLFELARKHVPEGSTLRAVRLRAGPLRGIDPQAMRWAWGACTDGRDCALELEALPWRLQCPNCGREFTAEDPFAPCTCGCPRAKPIGGDELQLVSIEVDEAPTARPP